MLWSEFKAVIRRSYLVDEDETTPKWSDAKLLDAFQFAQNELCAHTAMLAVYSITDGSAKDPAVPGVTWNMAQDTDFPLPSDIYEQVDLSGIVYITGAGGLNPEYFDPLFYSRNLSPYSAHERGYWTDATTLHLSAAPGTGKTLWLRYFAYWPYPASAEDDTFVIAAPQWALGPLAYLTAAHCLTGPGTRSANIRQWNEKQDSGKPQDNALTEQALYLIRSYEMQIGRHTRQDRANFFRVTE